MQCPGTSVAEKRPRRVRRSAHLRMVTVTFVICLLEGKAASAEPDAFISNREVTNADVFRQKQRQRQDIYDGQSDAAKFVQAILWIYLNCTQNPHAVLNNSISGPNPEGIPCSSISCCFWS